MGLQQFEKRLERIVESAFAKAFRSGLQPIEIGRKLAREMDLRRQISVHGAVAPNQFRVILSDEDFRRFEPYLEAVEMDLIETAHEHAREEGYHFVGTVVIDLIVDPRLRPSTFEVEGIIQASSEGQVPARLLLPNGKRVSIGAESVCIGRSPECEVVVSDPSVSRRHAEVRRVGNDIVIIDLGSTNGTKVNGANISRQRLRDGDEITVGSTNLLFENI